MSTTADIEAETLQRFIAGWRAWTMDSFFANLADDFTQKPLPFSAMHPPRTRDELYPVLTTLMSVLTNFKLTIHNTIHDPTTHTAALYTLAEADSPLGPYRNEQAVFVWFSPAGDKIQRIEELFDTVFMRDFMPRFRAYMDGM
ncbi:hypothetical protein E4U43_004049 [Claviceps pusilla]|uniref:SnoaL-like domain-containing protein n=1 Tax=Claviceps pusilla TaxID=123648 RepID=A0A9P7SU71_9HYPO|nr:hypothetical protein E4U43_004049 [Claviceps pusilla]